MDRFTSAFAVLARGEDPRTPEFGELAVTIRVDQDGPVN